MAMRVHDVLPSKGLTSFHWNGPQVVIAACGPFGPILRVNFGAAAFAL